MVNLLYAQVMHKPQDAQAHYAARIPNVETWHCRLGHCNARSIINMARGSAIEGMKVDLSQSPP